MRGEDLLLELDQTIFFPTGGGQSCDTGIIAALLPGDTPDAENTFPVTEVFEENGRILHRISGSGSNALSGSGSAVLTPGTRIFQKINWDRRFDNMQRHCGEHILSGMFHREFGGVNHGFHMGEDSMTIDIRLEKNPDYKTLTWEMAKHAERCANEVIWQNAPVTVRHFENRAEAEQMPLRKELAIDEDITIVTIGDPQDPFDCVACCGTHPNSAGSVGLIKIWKIEPNKGMFRIYCEAGRRAYLDYEKKHDLITTIGTRYSAGPEDLLDKLSIAEEKNKRVRSDLASVRKIVIDSRIDEIQKALNEGEGLSESPLLLRKYADLPPDSLNPIGKPFIGKTDRLIVIADEKLSTALLFSDGKHFDCGQLVRENAAAYQGKGGGRADNARVVFPDSELLGFFIDLLAKRSRQEEQ